MQCSPNTLSHIFVVGFTHKSASLVTREKLSLTPEYIHQIYSLLKQDPAITECFILSTCNRIEIYGVTQNNRIHTTIHSLLSDLCTLETTTLLEQGVYYSNKDAINHLLQVICGLDSQIIGENEIVSQIKKAYTQANHHYQTIGPILHKLLQKSFQIAKWIRTHTHINKGHTSIGTVATQLAVRIFENLEKVPILLIGAGEVAEITLQALINKGSRNITIANRTFLNAQKIAEKHKAQAILLDHIEEYLPFNQIVIGSSCTQKPILDKYRLEKTLHSHHSLFLIDLAIPRNFDPNCTERSNTYLYDLDDLATIANHHLKNRQAELIHCKNILEEKTAVLWTQIKKHLDTLPIQHNSTQQSLNIPT